MKVDMPLNKAVHTTYIGIFPDMVETILGVAMFFKKNFYAVVNLHKKITKTNEGVSSWCNG